LKKVGARGRLAVLLAACLACLAMLWKQGVYTVREQPGTRPSPLPTLALAAPLSRVAVAPLSVEATPPPPDGEEGICPKAGSIVISFLCGYGPLSSPRSRSTRLKQYDKTVVTPDAAWEKIHEEFESALKSILLSTRLDLTLIGACPCSNCLLHCMKRACVRAIPCAEDECNPISAITTPPRHTHGLTAPS